MEKDAQKRFSLLIKIGILLFFLIGFGAWYGLSEYNRTAKSLVNIDANYNLSSRFFIDEFENNAEMSDLKYQTKIISIDGILEKIEKKGNSTILSLGNTSKIRCNMDSTQQIGRLKEGYKITIKGEYIGYNEDDLLGSDIILNRCIVVNEK